MQSTQHYGPPTFDPVPFAFGDRVTVEVSGRTGTVVSHEHRPHSGWRVRWDEPVFGVTESWVRTVHMQHATPEEETT